MPPEKTINKSVTDPSDSRMEAGHEKPKQAEGPKKKVTLLEIHRLPSPEEIRDAIPPEGIDYRDLASKFSTVIDETNVGLFIKLALSVSDPEVRLMLKPLEEIPSQLDWNKIVAEARKPALREPQPKPNICDVSLRHIGDIEVTFSEPEELMRGSGKILPKALYRVFYETSATLSRYVGEETEVRHRERPDLQLHADNAFQSIGTFQPRRDLSKGRVERHLSWQTKKDPSSYISAFNSLGRAAERAIFHYNTSQRIGQRTSIAKISTKGLIAATVRMTVEKTIRQYRKLTEVEQTRVFPSQSQVPKLVSETVTTEDLQIPIWIRDSGVPENCSKMTVEQLENTTADIWMSITELRRSNLQVSSSKGHDYEWLACGRIPTTRVTKVMPFDGKVLYSEKPNHIVTSRDTKEKWYFDWEEKMWKLRNPSRSKRPADAQDDSTQDTPDPKRPKLSEDSASVSGESAYSSEDESSEAYPGQESGAPCPVCGHQPSSAAE